MEKELSLSVPTSLSEMSLGQFISLLKENYQEVLGLGDEMEFIPFETLRRTVNILSSIPFTAREIEDHFEMSGQVFVIFSQVDDWTLEERVMLERLTKDNDIDDLHKLIALHTRPAKKRKLPDWKTVRAQGFRKTVQDYRKNKTAYVADEWNRDEFEKRCELFKNSMPADLAYTIAVFFAQFGQELIKTSSDAILKNHPGI